jgi:hypothetical protein
MPDMPTFIAPARFTDPVGALGVFGKSRGMR